MPRKQSDIFKHYAEVKENGKVVKYICKYCSQHILIEMLLKKRNTSKNVKSPSSVK